MKDLLKKQLVKKAARTAAPMLKKAVKKDPRVAAALWAAEKVMGRKHKSAGSSRMGLAARGLAAAAVALPIGLMVGYRMRSGD